MSIVTIVNALILAKKKFLHLTFKLFMISVFIEFFSFIFTMAEYIQFSSSGIEIRALKTIGQVLNEVAQTILLLVVILLAKGYNVNHIYMIIYD